MSLKAQTFKTVVTTPLLTFNYLVEIPGMGEDSIAIQTTSLPAESQRYARLFVGGEPVDYSTIPETSHTWSFTVPDDESARIYSFFKSKSSIAWNQRAGVQRTSPGETIKVYLRTLTNENVLQVTLHDCWIVGRQEVQLNQSDPTAVLMWTYTFHYGWLEDGVVNG